MGGQVIVRSRDEMVEGKSSPKGLENPQVNLRSGPRENGRRGATHSWDGNVKGLPAHRCFQDCPVFIPGVASCSFSVENLSLPQELRAGKANA